jgi:hypothetical protein
VAWGRMARGAEEKVKSKGRTYILFLRFFAIFRFYFWSKIFEVKNILVVFELLMQRDGQTRYKKIEGKMAGFCFSQLFVKSF